MLGDRIQVQRRGGGNVFSVLSWTTNTTGGLAAGLLLALLLSCASLALSNMSNKGGGLVGADCPPPPPVWTSVRLPVFVIECKLIGEILNARAVPRKRYLIFHTLLFVMFCDFDVISASRTGVSRCSSRMDGRKGERNDGATLEEGQEGQE
jgi:hypothetical protein